MAGYNYMYNWEGGNYYCTIVNLFSASVHKDAADIYMYFFY